ncbi:MAG TPA: hypothetical protein VGR35_08295 [Tepidisphaeraceae bacterium]|nr:hypothetical protein [Tepidisphaeraceae bacterium]
MIESNSRDGVGGAALSHSSHSSESRSASPAQKRANRRNAKRSSGPRSAEGKRAASRNAITHGLFCQDAVLPGESMLEFRAFRALLLASRVLMPQDYVELSLAEQYVLARWKLRRIGSAEQVIHEEAAQGLADVNRIVDPGDYDRYIYGDLDALNMFDRVKKADDAEAAEDEAADEADEAARDAARQNSRMLFSAMAQRREVPVATTLALSMIGNAEGGGGREGAYERVGRYQQRLEQSASRALRELRQVRKDKGVDIATLATCPFLEVVGDEADVAELRELHARRETREAREERGREKEMEPGRQEEVVAAEKVPADGVTEPTPPAREQPAGTAAPIGIRSDVSATAQNEPNSHRSRADADGAMGCEQGARHVEIVEPTKLVPSKDPAPRREQRRGSD